MNICRDPGWLWQVRQEHRYEATGENVDILGCKEIVRLGLLCSTPSFDSHRPKSKTLLNLITQQWCDKIAIFFVTVVTNKKPTWLNLIFLKDHLLLTCCRQCSMLFQLVHNAMKVGDDVQWDRVGTYSPISMELIRTYNSHLSGFTPFEAGGIFKQEKLCLFWPETLDSMNWQDNPSC